MAKEFRNLLGKDSLRYVSHYTSFDGFTKICKGQTLKMGKMHHVNDLDEIQHPGVTVYLKGIDRSDLSKMENLVHKIPSSILKLYNDNVVVSCFSRSVHRYGPIGASDTSFGNNVLWGTYANNLSGVALVFDPMLLKKQIILYFEGIDSDFSVSANDIEYTDGLKSRTNIHSFSVMAKDFEGSTEEDFEIIARRATASHAEVLLFNKRGMWVHENEWRIIAISGVQGPHFIPYKDALKAVVIGPRAPVSPSVIARTIDVPVFSIGKSGSRPGIDLLGPF